MTATEALGCPEFYQAALLLLAAVLLLLATRPWRKAPEATLAPPPVQTSEPDAEAARLHRIYTGKIEIKITSPWEPPYDPR